MLCGPSTVHEVAAGADGAIMLHVYAGIRRGMRLRTRDGQTLVVPADHGAWLPAAEAPAPTGSRS